MELVAVRICREICELPAEPGKTRCAQHLQLSRISREIYILTHGTSELRALKARQARDTNKTNGKCLGSWKCKNEITEGQTLCEYHKARNKIRGLKYRFKSDGQELQNLVLNAKTCDLRGKPFIIGDKNRSPVIDHDHTTGRVRGILHGLCNIGLGAFEDKPEILQMAAQYLKRNNSKEGVA